MLRLGTRKRQGNVQAGAAASLPEPTPYQVDAVQDNLSVRTVDDYFFSTCSRRLLFDKPPMLTQSLRFDQGSQQAMHQDTAFVRMNSPMKLAAVWIVLEDIQAGSGELINIPAAIIGKDFYSVVHSNTMTRNATGRRNCNNGSTGFTQKHRNAASKQRPFARKKAISCFGTPGWRTVGRQLESLV